MNGVETIPGLDRIQKWALIVGLVVLAVCLAGAFANPDQFFQSYLVAYLFWLGLTLGSAAMVMLHHLTGGGWGLLIRRVLESATRTLPLMLVLLIPLFVGLHNLYEWSHTDAVANNQILQQKSRYLNVPFFSVRAVSYFAIWFVLAYLLNKWSSEQDRTADPAMSRRLQILSGPGLILYGATVTFASIDWVMSLEPHWYSTIYGLLFMVGQALSTIAFGTFVATRLAGRKPLSDIVTPQRLNDLGNLMLAFVMLWAYVAFSQFLIIWSGNLPEEIPWYLRRLSPGWQGVGIVLIVFHFALPFVLLLSRATKRNTKTLAMLAIALLIMRLVDLLWMVSPVFHQTAHVHWLDVAMPVGIGGVWVAVFAWQLKSRALLPIHDPGLKEAMAEHG